MRCPKCKNDVPVTYLFCPYCGYDLRFIIKERLIARLSFRERILRIMMLIRNPFKTIEHIASAPDLMGGFIVALICGLLLFGKVAVLFLKNGVGLNLTAVAYLIMGAVFFQIVLWLFLSIAIHIAMKIVGGVGVFRDVMSLVGYNQIFIAIAHVVSIVVVSASSPSTVNGVAVFMGTSFLYVPFWLGVAFLVGYGLAYTHMLKKITAILASIISVFVFVFFFYLI